MSNAIVGFSGYVGAPLLKQAGFESIFRSINIGEIEDKSFDTVVCARVPEQKWITNRESEADRQKIEGDDGQPIFLDKHPELPGFYSVLGGKIDKYLRCTGEVG